MKTSFEYIFGGIFSVVGLGMLIGAMYAYQSQQKFLKTAQTTEGTVQELVYSRSKKGSGTYHPVVAFEASDGKHYTFHSDMGTNPPSYNVGERVEVRYNPTNPYDAMLTGFWSMWGLIAIFGGLGTIFSSIGLGVIIGKIRKNKTTKYLIENGTPVEVPARVEYNTTKGKRSYYIRGEWYNPTDGKMYLFDSEQLPFDPSYFIKQPVKVLIDPRNPKRYVMDLSFLPPMGT